MGFGFEEVFPHQILSKGGLTFPAPWSREEGSHLIFSGKIPQTALSAGIFILKIKYFLFWFLIFPLQSLVQQSNFPALKNFITCFLSMEKFKNLG